VPVNFFTQLVDSRLRAC